MNPNDITDWAARLQEAERTHVPVAQLSASVPGVSLAQAYAIARAGHDLRRQAGRRLRGYKVAMTSRATQALLGASEPSIGWLWDDMLFDNGSRIAPERFGAANVELELAFVLARPLQGPHVTALDVLNATDFVVPAFEIVDARIALLNPATKTPRQLVDLVADNSVAAGAVLGGRPMRPTELDLAWAGAVLHKNGAIEETGLGATVMGNPAHSVAWLANTLCQWGERLEPGQIVLSGTLTKPTPVRAGDVVQGDFGRLGLVGWSLR